jgi:hypothetical protein
MRFIDLFPTIILDKILDNITNQDINDYMKTLEIPKKKENLQVIKEFYLTLNLNL